MSTYADLKQDVIDLINRNDCTTALAETFLQQAQRKIARTLRLPSLEKRQIVTAGTTSASVYNATTGVYTLPSDFLELVYVYTNKRILERLPLSDFIEISANHSASGPAKYYTRVQNTFEFAPIPQTGDVLNIVYQGDPATLVNPTDTNIFSEICPDLFVYAAILYACDYFNDARKPLFEDTYNKLFSETQILAKASDDPSVDASVRPAFAFANDLFN